LPGARTTVSRILDLEPARQTTVAKIHDVPCCVVLHLDPRVLTSRFGVRVTSSLHYGAKMYNGSQA
jgi:hypothetical protein